MWKTVAAIISVLACASTHPPQRLLAPAPPDAKSLAPLWVGPSYSGMWYTPERSGEGWVLQILENGTALALWFTYPPLGSPGRQAWIYAQDGVLDGERIRFTNTFSTRGPRFGPGFDSSQTRLVPWGTLEFRFTGCNDGEVSYAGPAGWGSGTRRIARITELAELKCGGGKQRLTAQGARSLEGLRQRSGLWFDPTHNGEGWAFEELPDGRTNFFWFTYDENGEQAWTNGVSATSGERIVVEDNRRPVGTHFGADFNPADVNRSPWGRIELTFGALDCDAGLLRYDSTDAAFGSGTLHPVRVARLAGTACVSSAPGVPTGGAWSTARPLPTPQSEVATTSRSGVTWIATGFGDSQSFYRYDAAADTWQTLARVPGGRDHAIAAAIGGDVFVTGGYENGAGDQGNPGWRYDIAADRWTALPLAPPAAASGGASFGGFAYFATVSGDIYQMDPRTLATRVIARDGRAPRDHSQLVAFQGELWLIGGRTVGFAISPRVSIYDPASETWRAGPDLGTPRSGFAAAASDQVIIVAGGEVLVNPFRVVTTVESIAAGQDAWTRIATLPTPVHGVGGAIHGNAFYAIGGSTQAATAANTAAVQVYRWEP